MGDIRINKSSAAKKRYSGSVEHHIVNFKLNNKWSKKNAAGILKTWTMF